MIDAMDASSGSLREKNLMTRLIELKNCLQSNTEKSICRSMIYLMRLLRPLRANLTLVITEGITHTKALSDSLVTF